MPRNNDVFRAQLFSLMARPNYAPLRKRKLARKLGVSEKEYAEFRKLIDELSAAGAVRRFPRGKFGLPEKAGERGGRGGRGGRGAAGGAPQARKQPGKQKKASPADSGGGEKLHGHKLPKNTLVGRVEIKRGGFGFLLSEPPGQDWYIAPPDLGGAMSGDRVAAVPKRRANGRRRGGGRGARGGNGGRSTARVVKVLERARKLLVGTFYSHPPGPHDPPEGPGGFVAPDAKGLFEDLEVPPSGRGGARDGDKVALELIEPETPLRSGAPPTGRVVKVYGAAGEARAEIAAIIQNFDLRTEFPEEVRAQAEALSEEIPPGELAARADYSSPLTFTIDPQDARDHDDAVALRELDGGRVELLVHIADVSHYVPEDSPLDREAQRRATSVYLPGRVLPMLPEKLSNQVCSLREGRPRLTKTLAVVYSKTRQPEAVRIERSFIRSAASLTYDQVKAAVDGKDPQRVPSREIHETLRRMKRFAAQLRKKRMEAGSLDLDLPEVRLRLDEHGAMRGSEKVESHWAHQLIEEMMLAANRAVAEYLVTHEIPGLFRMHEEPDPEALENFARFVREFGVSLKKPYTRRALQKVLDRVRGKEYRHAVQLGLLTSLKQARYAASCPGHYALAFTRYLHFTSPIRRYPDLIVHRALDGCFEPGQTRLPERRQGKRRAGRDDSAARYARQAALVPLASHCSERERAAEQAEKEVRKVRQLQYLRENQRASHPGVITGVREFGLFVELQDIFVEGLVRVQDLTDDFYEYFKPRHLLQGRRRGRSFQLGDPVRVRVLHIDLGQREVHLTIV